VVLPDGSPACTIGDCPASYTVVTGPDGLAVCASPTPGAFPRGGGSEAPGEGNSAAALALLGAALALAAGGILVVARLRHA